MKPKQPTASDEKNGASRDSTTAALIIGEIKNIRSGKTPPVVRGDTDHKVQQIVMVIRIVVSCPVTFLVEL